MEKNVILPYRRKRELADLLGISPATVQQRCGEMETSGRYGPYAVIRDGQVLLINTLCFVDWMRYRRELIDTNLRKYVPPFDAEAVARSMGWKIDKVSLRRVAV
jgi:DNA-binding Lrp family transcriptional regulator